MSKNYPRGIEDVEIIRPETLPQTVPSRALYRRSWAIAIGSFLIILGLGLWATSISPAFGILIVVPIMACSFLMVMAATNITVYDRAGKIKTVKPDWGGEFDID